LTPCFFSAECRPARTRNDDTEAQLAMNSNPILVIFALMYLDIRTSIGESMPGWMWVYALIYTEDGFDIYTHSLSTRISPKLNNTESKGKDSLDAKASSPDASKKTRFVFRSTRLVTKYSTVFLQTTGRKDRMLALTALFMIRAHTLFVVEQVEKWAEKVERDGGGMMDKIIARAQYELGNVEWLQKKIERLNQEGKGNDKC
jgi:hypothetical protein